MPSSPSADAILRTYYERVLLELRRVVRELRGMRDASMRTSDVMQELCLRLMPQLERTESPESLVPLAATTARHFLIDATRKRNRRDERLLPREELEMIRKELHNTTGIELASLHEYLDALDERVARIVDLRLFAGLSRREIARTCGDSEHFVRTTLGQVQQDLQRLAQGTS